MAQILAQAVLGALLLLTSGWCLALHQQLRRLRVERGEVIELVSLMNAASERAEAALSGMRAAGSELERTAAGRADDAARRAGELAKLIESGTRLLRRLEPAVQRGILLSQDHQGGVRAPRADPMPRDGSAAGRTGAAPGHPEQDALRRALETLR